MVRGRKSSLASEILHINKVNVDEFDSRPSAPLSGACVTTDFEKNTHFDKTFYNCVNFGTKSTHFEKKYSHSTSVVAKMKGMPRSLIYNIPLYVTMDYEK